MELVAGKGWRQLLLGRGLREEEKAGNKTRHQRGRETREEREKQTIWMSKERDWNVLLWAISLTCCEVKNDSDLVLLLSCGDRMITGGKSVFTSLEYISGHLRS